VITQSHNDVTMQALDIVKGRNGSRGESSDDRRKLGVDWCRRYLAPDIISSSSDRESSVTDSQLAYFNQCVTLFVRQKTQNRHERLVLSTDFIASLNTFAEKTAKISMQR